MASLNEQRTLAQLREHYQIEKELANRLRRATKEERRSLYNTVYDERLRRIPHHPLLAQAADSEAQLRAVRPQLRLLQPFLHLETVFLEIGPGDCALSLAVAQQVKKVYAVDVSAGLVRDSVYPANFELRLSDGINIPVPANSVHVAYSNQMMEHLHPEDALEQLQQIYEALMPGGIYLCITPNPLSGPWDISRHFDQVATGFHLKEYKIAELAAIFRSAGFARVDTFLSYLGYRLSPRVPLLPFVWLESVLACAPQRVRRHGAQMLTAVKLVAIK